MAGAVAAGQDDRTTFIGCFESDIMEDGITLGSVVKIAFSRVGIDVPTTASAENKTKQYIEYCTKFGAKLGLGDPYSSHAKVSQLNLSVRLDELASIMESLLPAKGTKNQEMRNMIGKAVDAVKKKNGLSFRELVYDVHSRTVQLAEFAVIKICRNAEGIEFVPCHMTVRAINVEASVLSVFNLASAEMEVVYEEKMYYMDPFKLKKCIRLAKEEAEAF